MKFLENVQGVTYNTRLQIARTAWTKFLSFLNKNEENKEKVTFDTNFLYEVICQEMMQKTIITIPK